MGVPVGASVNVLSMVVVPMGMSAGVSMGVLVGK